MELDFSKKLVCGVLNVTPDSFSDGGIYNETEKAINRVFELVELGADLVDIGGQSSRPFSKPVSVDEELSRVIPVITQVKKKNKDIIISLDTYYPEVAEEGIKYGVDIINDITGFRNEKMIELVLKHNKYAVVMHMKGTPENMQLNPYYDDVIKEVYNFLEDRVNLFKKEGFNKVIVDPGIGFGKRLEDNIEILKKLYEFKKLKCPIMLGTSRKSFIGKITGEEIPHKRVAGTIATCLFCYDWADIFRVHDVYETVQAFKVYSALKR